LFAKVSVEVGRAVAPVVPSPTRNTMSFMPLRVLLYASGND
jgi:hypothetical protein